MKKIAEVNDAVGISEFVFRHRDGHQIFVNDPIIEGPTFTGPAVVVMTFAWEDAELGWRYHAVAVNSELKRFMEEQGARGYTIYVGELDIDWTVDASSIIEKGKTKAKTMITIKPGSLSMQVDDETIIVYHRRKELVVECTDPETAGYIRAYLKGADTYFPTWSYLKEFLDSAGVEYATEDFLKATKI
jgi:hypothetical protein